MMGNKPLGRLQAFLRVNVIKLRKKNSNKHECYPNPKGKHIDFDK
jgi:hypothetical protein